MDRSQLKTLLYVDDEPDIRVIAEMALGLIDDVTVVTCASGQEALSTFPRLRPDLVLLDVMMPGMDGPALLGLLHAGASLPRAPIIFVTAKAMPQEIAHFRALGAAGVIAKPFDPMQIGEQVLLIWDALRG